MMPSAREILHFVCVKCLRREGIYFISHFAKQNISLLLFVSTKAVLAKDE